MATSVAQMILVESIPQQGRIALEIEDEINAKAAEGCVCAKLKKGIAITAGNSHANQKPYKEMAL